jgi:hypothetical protein
MDSVQLEFIIEQASKCPIDATAANARAVYYLLYGYETPECIEISTRSTASIVKDIVFTLPETDAWIEDNFPNPFTNETLINYYLPEETQGQIIVSDMFGKTVVKYNLNYGENTLTVKSLDWSPGVYNYNFIVGDKIIEVKKMIVTQ